LTRTFFVHAFHQLSPSLGLACPLAPHRTEGKPDLKLKTD
jgi:hypothetical protein